MGSTVQQMSDHPFLSSDSRLFDRIVFNFPHHPDKIWFREHAAVLIILHQELVRGFFKSAYKLLDSNGEVHVTHKTAHPFDRWEIEDLADEAGLCLVRKVRFSRWDYPGSATKKGKVMGLNVMVHFL